ncbi:glycosyltransferase family 4 protein [Legionella dresdenensis]|uniref:Glycosyltransferase family 4 protein n=1 Tax=Legionella dresdenensis TaxID=450200 RepID=A0ABV8CCK6_9GAMM
MPGLYLILILTISYLLTGSFRKYSLANQILDMPNHRSAHKVPTPRGGGLVFVIIFLLSLLVLFTVKLVTLSDMLSLLISGILIASIGFLDDRQGVSAKKRLLVHFASCSLALLLVGGMPAIEIGSLKLTSVVFTNLLAVFYLVWLLNLYNFMDGIDGIAASEAIFCCCGAAIIYYLQGNGPAMILPLVLAGTVAGFLIWNFPPARIFMGDAGSGFLGLVLGVFSIQAATVNPDYLWSWLILLGVFIVDATMTLLRRALNKENLAEAHNSHAYQHAARYYGSHLKVTLAVVFINALWLLPLAILVSDKLINGLLGVLIAYIPLVILALKYQAGKK